MTLPSCGSPLHREFDPKTIQTDIQDIKEEHCLDSTETALLTTYITIGNIEGRDLNGKTYADILVEAIEFQREKENKEKAQKEISERKKKGAEARFSRLRKAMDLVLLNKGVQSADWQEFLTFSFALENRSDKDIRAFKGRVVFTDLFDEEIYSLNLTYDEHLPAGETVNWDVRTNYNPYMNNDVLLKSKSLQDLKILWQPEKIIFSDNSTL